MEQAIPQGYKTVTEGVSAILIPESGGIFYNPVQEFNRDLSVAVIKAFQETYLQEKPHILSRGGITILDALTASGFRAIRYAQQVPNVRRIFANDLDPNAVEIIQRNCSLNRIPEGLIEITTSDASLFMYSRVPGEKLDVIDLDPYGTASPFFDAAIQAVSDGGLLCITCTDMAVLAGVYPEKCFALYQGIPLHNEYGQEMAVRLVLSSLETTANKYQKHIEPILAARIDFYVRVFVRVYKSPLQVKQSLTYYYTQFLPDLTLVCFRKKSYVYACNQCRSYYLQPLGFMSTTAKGNTHLKFSYATLPDQIVSECLVCGGGGLQIGGPIWSAPMQNKPFLSNLINMLKRDELKLGTLPRIQGELYLLYEELDTPLYLSIPHLAKVVHCVSPPLLVFKSALLNAGYRVSISHCNPLGIKTNAPIQYLWDIIREWVKDHPVKQDKNYEGTLSHKILSRPISRPVDLGINEMAKPSPESKGLVRFFCPTEQNWGPLAKAKSKRKNI